MSDAQIMTPAQYNDLPSRQGISGLPIVGQFYRDEAYPNLIFQCMHADNHRVQWFAHTVKLAVKADDKLLLKQAADWLEAHGWTRGVYFRHHDRTAMSIYEVMEGHEPASCCIVGAVYLQMMKLGRMPLVHEAHNLLHQYGIDIDWNDQPGRTEEEVIAKLREFAA